MAARFPYLPFASVRGEAFHMPVLPLALSFGNHEPVTVQALVDSGATVNVMPYGLGVRLGAVWEAQTTQVQLTGNLSTQEARALVVQARLADFPAVRLVFAWTRNETVPVLLGQINFFEEFDICFHRRRMQIEVQPART